MGGTGQSEMYDRHQRGSSCPIPSSGNSQTSLGKPPRRSKDSLSTKSLNERNDLVETLRHENAGLKEKLSRLSQNDREKKPKKKRKSRDYPSKDESYHGQGDEVIEIIHQKNNYFQKMFESSKEENLLMNKKIANQIEEIDRLQQENKSLKEASRRT